MLLWVSVLQGQPAETVQGGAVLLPHPAPAISLSLKGDWWFRHGKLIHPDSGLSGFSLHHFPFLWTDEAPHSLPPVGSATYKVMLRSPGENHDWGLEIPDMYSAFVLYAGSTEIARNGRVSENPDSIVAQWLPLTVPLPVFTDSLWLTLHVSNRDHAKAGIRLEILAGRFSFLSWKRDMRLAMDWLLAGCLLLSGVFMIGLFLFSRGDKAMLFYGLVSVTWSYRVVGFGSYALHAILPGIPWSLGLHLEYLALFLTTGWFALYIYALYPKETSKRFLWSLMAVVSTFIAVVLFFPPAVFTTLVAPFFYFLIAALVYGIVVFVRAALAKRSGARLSLVSTGVLFLVFGYNILVYLGQFPDVPFLTFVGYFLFFVLQSIILGVRYADSLQRSVSEMKAASDLKGRFLAQMSHELRTPLNAIIGYAQLLSADQSLSARPKNHVTILQNSAHHLLSMINEILDFSRLDDGEVKLNRNSFRLAELARDLQTLFQLQTDEKGLAFSVESTEDDPRLIRADELRIRQVLINLIGNAVKFTDSGFIKVALELKKPFTPGGEWRLSATVSDSGRGIPESDKEIIFQPFRQVTGQFSQGTGLGLAITKRLVTLMNGSITVESRPGGGSDFAFQIPVQTLDVTQTSPVTAAGLHPIPEGLRIFIVDDVVANGIMLQEMLRPHRAVCTVVQSAAEARERFKPELYDLVLTDLNMPVESGQQLFMSLQNLYQKELPPFIAVTADITHASSEVLKAGFSELLYKPFEQKLLLEKISAAVHRTRTAPPPPVETGGVRKWLPAFRMLDSELADALQEALSFADLGGISNRIPQLPEGPLKAEIVRGVQHKDFKFLMDLGHAAENDREKRA